MTVTLPTRNDEGAEKPQRQDAIAMIGRGLAHDINNLMETVLGNAALLRGDLGGGHPHIATLEAIEKAAELAGRLTERILALTQGEDDKGESININSIVYHLLLVEETHLAPDIRIVRRIDPDLWKVRANHTELAQVLLSLATNAVESIAKSGQVTIHTRNVHADEDTIPADTGLKPGPYVLVSVEDDGCGLTAEELRRVFEPGYSTKEGRAGQGLAAVASIVRAYQGFVTANSFEGRGSVFRVYLPAATTLQEPIAAPSEDLPRGNETVLIVDDERMIAEVMQETLKRLGYKTLMARNGQEAVDIAYGHEGPIDLTLLDMAMPVMGGADAYPLLKQAHPRMKVIVCTGFEQELISGDLLRSGVDAFLIKPFRLAALAQEVRKVLDGAHAA